jgi:hypothetical protein
VVCGHYGVCQVVAADSKDPRMSKQSFAGKRMNMTLMILNKLEIIIKLGSGLKPINHQVKEISRWTLF